MENPDRAPEHAEATRAAEERCDAIERAFQFALVHDREALERLADA